MKVIDLLNKIANGEIEDGFKFAVDGIKFTYKKAKQNWTGDTIVEPITGDKFFKIFNFSVLNDEIEIIEPEEELKEIERLNSSYRWNNDFELSEKNYQENGRRTVNIMQEIINKVDELIENQNKIIRKMKENEKCTKN